MVIARESGPSYPEDILIVKVHTRSLIRIFGNQSSKHSGAILIMESAPESSILYISSQSM